VLEAPADRALQGQQQRATAIRVGAFSSSEVGCEVGCSHIARAQAISSLERFPAPVTSVSDLTILRGFTVPMLNALVSL
jgi:hypothetical protein